MSIFFKYKKMLVIKYDINDDDKKIIEKTVRYLYG